MRRTTSVARAAFVAGWLSSLALLAAGDRRARADGAFPDAQSVLLPADRPAQIVLAANFGLVFSDDGGAHWQYSCEAQATANGKLYGLGAAPDDRLFSLSDYGVATSADMGCGWTLGGGPFDGGRVLDYFADPTDPARVLAVAEPPGVNGLLPAQVFESRDGGTTYPTVVHPGVAGGGISGVEIARSDAGVVYVTLFDKSAADALPHPRLARSGDRGATWETIDLEPMLGASRVAIAAIDPTDANRLFLRVSGTNAEMRSVDSIAVSADGGHSFARPVNLTGGTLIAFIARAGGTVLASGLLGATPVGYRSRDRGDTWTSWPPGLHARGFGERGSTLYVAADDANDGFALASSEDDGDSWTPRMRFADITAVRSCSQQACLVDCWQKVTLGLFAPPVCGEAPPTEPAADGGAGGAGGGDGCGGCAAAGGGTEASASSGVVAMAIAVAVAVGVAVARRRGRRRRRGRGRGREQRRGHAPRALLLAVALSTAAVAGPRVALGYVRMKTPAGVPYRQASPCLPITVHLGGFPGVSDDDMRAAVTGAARAWTAETNPCTNLAIAIAFADGAGPPAGDDGTNVLGARADGWCRATTEVSPADAGTCNPPSATAATSVFAAADGRITGGDIDLNTLTFAWAALDPQGNPADRQDLQSVLTHEIGHLIGLDHTCWSGIGDHATDDHGDPVPDCYAAPAAIKADTMFPTIDPGDISKRPLSPEAVRAVCEIYPALPASPPASCAIAGASGCTIAPAPAPPPDAPTIIAAAALLALALTRRLT